MSVEDLTEEYKGYTIRLSIERMKGSMTRSFPFVVEKDGKSLQYCRSANGAFHWINEHRLIEKG